jgi:hypothetical protein
MQHHLVAAAGARLLSFFAAWFKQPTQHELLPGALTFLRQVLHLRRCNQGVACGACAGGARAECREHLVTALRNICSRTAATIASSGLGMQVLLCYEEASVPVQSSTSGGRHTTAH